MTVAFPNYAASPMTREFSHVPNIHLVFGAGNEQRISRGIRIQREWHVVFADHTAREVALMKQFLEQQNGIGRFRWRPIRNAPNVTVTCAQWQIEHIGSGVAHLRAVFVESTALQTFSVGAS